MDKMKVSNPEGRISTVRTKKGVSLTAGDEESFREVHRTEVTLIRGGRERPLPQPMVTKKLMSVGEAQKVRDIYKICKDAGLKVIPTYRVDVDKRIALMTDLNRNGRLALSANNLSAEGPNPREFISSISNIESFLDSLFAHASSAGRTHLALPRDAYFFLVDKGSSRQENLDFLIGDFDDVTVRQPVDRGSEEVTLENIDSANRALDGFLQRYVIAGPTRYSYLELLDRRHNELTGRKKTQVESS